MAIVRPKKMNWIARTSIGFVASGWLLPFAVYAWFSIISASTDSEDYGAAIGAFLVFYASYWVSWFLLGSGTVGLMRSFPRTRTTRAFLGVGVFGFVLATILLLLIAMS